MRRVSQRRRISTTENIPSLAGQTDRYLQWQLVYFRTGTRKSEIMNPVAEALTNEDIRDLGNYIAHLPAPEPAAAAQSDLVEKGRALAAQIAVRLSWREARRQRPPQLGLSVSAQDYLLKALQDFKAGNRVGGGMAAMADVVYPLSPDDLPALAAYAASALTLWPPREWARCRDFSCFMSRSTALRHGLAIPSVLAERARAQFTTIGLVLSAGTLVRAVSAPVAGRSPISFPRCASSSPVRHLRLQVRRCSFYATSFAALLSVMLAYSAALAPVVPLSDALSLAAAGPPGRGAKASFRYGWFAARDRLRSFSARLRQAN